MAANYVMSLANATLLRILLLLFLSFSSNACIWDAESLSHEKARSHDLAETILGAKPTSEDTNQLRATIKNLEANRKEDDVNWWNNLAGAHLRLNEPQAAVTLLEPVVAKFPDDYGIHANLGTAYHLLGRYAEAEKEIARDLEINPNAHFGLEKYHLALLQYLIRDPKYQARHVYVDEFTFTFLINDGSAYYFKPWAAQTYEDIAESRARDYGTVEAAEAVYQSVLKTNGERRETLHMLATVALSEAPPAYRTNSDLRNNTNFEAGIIYMAQMNPKEPACYVMLGIAAWKNENYHLAIMAFDRAIALGSPQSELLRGKTSDLKQFIRRSQQAKWNRRLIVGVVAGLPIALIVLFILWLTRRGRSLKN